MAKPLEKSGAKNVTRYAALDSLRGVCACMVALFHFVTTGFITNLPVVRGGPLFVDFFFVLSGFVIAASYGQRLSAGFSPAKFMFLRFGRLYPLHLAVLAMFVTLELLGMVIPGLTGRQPFTASRSLEGLLLNLLLLQTFDPAGGLTWNNPAWSIAAEFWTYLLAALIFRGAGRYATAVTLACVAASGLWLDRTPLYLGHTSDWGIIRCIYGFGWGMIAYRLFGGAQLRLANASRPLMSVAEAVVCGLALWLVAAGGAHPQLSMLAPPLFLGVIVILAAERGGLSALLLTRSMRQLGVLSYSIYLIHEFVQGRFLDVLKLAGRRLGFGWVATRPDGFKQVVAAPLVSDGLTLVMLVLVIGLARLTYGFIEEPAREWSRRAAGRIWRGQPAPQPRELLA